MTRLIAALKLVWSGSAGLSKIAEIEEAIRELNPEAAVKALKELEEIDPEGEE